ncbi:hypothetical protein E2C01_091212 [Portunus trituberculatus]|uniref:Uncharacterized protein n=1 Tax=Portunus trituberculatus TaxID=210409 RepID=A0A5B7JME0_PORTR|nr:hypothetical protein [Portunus trituberculatus]
MGHNAQFPRSRYKLNWTRSSHDLYRKWEHNSPRPSSTTHPLLPHHFHVLTSTLPLSCVASSTV